jgi:Domain of unknown function (DUF4260)
MKRLPIWFERIENLAIAATVVAVFVRLHFSWWWLPVFFLAFDASMAGYLVNNRAGAVCYNLAHAYVAPAVLLLSYVLSATRWCAFAGLLWAFHIAGDRVLGYGERTPAAAGRCPTAEARHPAHTRCPQLGGVAMMMF